MAFNVRIFLPDGVIDSGTISYSTKGPKLSNAENQPVTAPRELVNFSITDETIIDSAMIDEHDRISFDSLTFFRNMDLEHPITQDHYPPSTRGWIRYLSRNGPVTRIDLQEINNGERYLLSCIDVDTGKMLRFHSIKSYEANILRIEGDWERYNNLILETDDEETEEVTFENLLEEPAPSWEELQSLVQGITIPNLKRRDTIGETLSQLVPASFPEDVRKELMVFLAWTLKARVPDVDPLDYLYAINRSFKFRPRLTNLILGHIQCIIQDIPPPQYVRIFHLAERGTLTAGEKPQTESSEQDPWIKAWFRIEGLFPTRNDRIADLTNQLNRTQEIHTNLVITKEQAIESKDAWLDRFALIRSNFVMRGHIQDKKIGLEKLVYIGGAHRWPHKHLQYTARLGNIAEKPPYIQVMVMPNTSVDRISRIKQNIFSIDWSASRVNFNLYNAENDSWRYNKAHFLKSFGNSRTRKQLDKEFKLTSSSDIIQIEEQDTKLLDLILWGIYSQGYEVGIYDNLLSPMNNKEIQDRIEFYLKEKLVHLRYIPYTSDRVSLCFEIRGPVKQLYSISRSSLTHLPTANVMLSTPDELCIIMVRVPESDVAYFLTELPEKAKEHGITMKVYRVSAYAGYLHNLYQRLRRPDGTWDDDISGLLDQMTN